MSTTGPRAAMRIAGFLLGAALFLPLVPLGPAQLALAVLEIDLGLTPPEPLAVCMTASGLLGGAVAGRIARREGWRAPLALLLAGWFLFPVLWPPLGIGRAAGVYPILDAVTATGTGFFVGPRGDLLTAKHIVVGCAEIWVLSDSLAAAAPARLEAADDRLDVAVLRIRDRPASYAALVASPPTPGSELIAVGYPEAGLRTRATDTSFEVLPLPLPGLIVVREAGRPGISGSPLFDAGGGVVGMLVGSGRADTPEADAFEETFRVRLAEAAVAIAATELLPALVPAGAAGTATAGVAAPPAKPGTAPMARAAVVRVVCRSEA